MTFKELAESTQHHRPDYWEQLLLNHELIIRQVALSNKVEVSKALNIAPSQFSGIYQCIIAYSNIDRARAREA